MATCFTSEAGEPGEKLVGCGDEALGALHRLCGFIRAGVVLGEVRVFQLVAAPAKCSEGPEAWPELAAGGLLDGVVAAEAGSRWPRLPLPTPDACQRSGAP